MAALGHGQLLVHLAEFLVAHTYACLPKLLIASPSIIVSAKSSHQRRTDCHLNQKIIGQILPKQSTP
tara:strand:- start:3237 stop:3437 length:201 start_codon:yes stop_codon:yes gene_type:complete